jgi:L-lactate dehydrogenase complex protein LldF
MENKNANSLPFASSMCGACFEACPVKINIPEVLAYLRGKTQKAPLENSAFQAALWVMKDHRRFSAALSGRRLGASIASGLGLVKGWTDSREMPEVPAQSFRAWWSQRGK